MEHVLLVISTIIQIGLGSTILTQDVRSRAHRLFAAFMLISALGSLIALLRLVVTSERIAAALMVPNIIVVLIWDATAIALSTIAIFYPAWANRHLFWTIYLPVGIALLGTIAVLGIYVTMPDHTEMIRRIPGTDTFALNERLRNSFLAYKALCIAIVLALLTSIVVRRGDRRRPGAVRRSAAIVGLATLVVTAINTVGLSLFPGSLQVSVPALAGTLLAMVFAYVILRYRLFATAKMAVDLAWENLRDGIVVLRSDQVVLSCNRSAAALLGLPQRSLLNKHIDTALHASALPEAVWQDLWSALQAEHQHPNKLGTPIPPSTREARYTLGGTERVVINEATPVRDRLGQVQGTVWMLYDVTEQRRNEREIQDRNAELQRALREMQAIHQAQSELLETVRVLSAPAVPVLQGVIVLYLSGPIHRDRASWIMGNLLAGIREHDAKVALIDIAGVPGIDASVAGYLIQAARAGALMGCHSILTGIRPEIAQVLVDLGVDMGGLSTFSDLRSGIEYALQTLGIALMQEGA